VPDVVELANRKILKDWTRVDEFPVDERERRTFEYHVVEDMTAERVTLTIKCFNDESETIRLDPTVIPSGSDPDSYPQLAERRVRQLYSNGRI